VALASLTAILVVYLAALHTRTGQTFDNDVLRGHLLRDEWISASILTRLTRHSLLPLAAGSAVAVLIAVYRRRWHQACAAMALAAVSLAITEALKHVVITRPPKFPSTWNFNTFPSGHTTVAMAVAFGLTMVVPQAWRGRVATIAGLCAMIVANGTMATGWHRASDAMAACFVVSGVFAIQVVVMVRIGWLRPATAHRAQRLSRAAWPMLVIAAVGWALGLARLVGDLRTIRSGAATATATVLSVYVTADLLVVACVATSMVLGLVCLRGLTFDRSSRP
jgi:membrane-associated phospholipid phosphatase